MGRIWATADIGSNTAHLLIAEENGGKLNRLVNDSEWIGFGESLARHGHITPEVQADLFRALKSFKKHCKDHSVSKMFLFATEAMRAARNSDSVVRKVENQFDWCVNIITPEQEAQFSVSGARLDNDELDYMIEVGGGSVQIASAVDFRIKADVSLPLGTGRLAGDGDLSDPPTPSQQAWLKRRMARVLNAAGMPKVKQNAKVVICGGVARGIMRSLHPDGDRRLTRQELEYVAHVASRLSHAELGARFNVKAHRASTLFQGSHVYLALLKRMGVAEVQLSEYGVREGAIMEISSGRLKS